MSGGVKHKKGRILNVVEWPKTQEGNDFRSDVEGG